MIQPPNSFENKTPKWSVLISLLLLATLLRFPQLQAQSIAFDESFSLVVGQADWPLLFQAILSDGVHPPLFYMIHKVALGLWGISEFGQRFLVAGFSILSVALAYRAGAIFFSVRVGLLSALLLAINPLHIWFAQEARMYSLFGALSILSMLLFWQALHSLGRRYWVALALVNATIFSLHYFGFLIPIVQFAFIILTFQRNHRSLRLWTLVQVIAMLPLLPWLIATALRDAQNFGVGFLVYPTLLDLLETFWNMMIGGGNFFWPVTVTALMIMLFIIISAFRPMLPRKIQQLQARHLLLVWILLPPVMVWLISQRRSFYADRYLSFIIPGLILLLAFGISRIKTSQWRVLLIAGLLVANIYGLISTQGDPVFHKDDWRRTATYIGQNEQSDDVVLLYSTHIKFAFDYYFDSQIPQKPISLNLDNYPIEPLTEGHNRAWIVYPYTRRPTHYPMQPLLPDGYWADDPDRNPILDQWLADHQSNVVDYQHFRGIQVWLVELASPQVVKEN